jgi:hypothetical protein
MYSGESGTAHWRCHHVDEMLLGQLWRRDFLLLVYLSTKGTSLIQILKTLKDVLPGKSNTECAAPHNRSAVVSKSRGMGAIDRSSGFVHLIQGRHQQANVGVDHIAVCFLPHILVRIIHKLISREEQYLQDLDFVESLFIKPLRAANPPIMPSDQLEDLIDDIFGNIMDLRETNRHLLEVLYVRQREEGPIIQRIGDLFLDAASEFRYAYPTYIGHLPVSEKRLKEELESNNAFRLFLEV